MKASEGAQRYDTVGRNAANEAWDFAAGVTMASVYWSMRGPHLGHPIVGKGHSACFVQIRPKLVCFWQGRRCFGCDEKVLDVLATCHLPHWAVLRAPVGPELDVEVLVRFDNTSTGEFDTSSSLPLLEKRSSMDDKCDRWGAREFCEVTGI